MLWWGCSGGGPEEPKKAQKWSENRSETVWDEEALPQDLAGPVVKMRFFCPEKRWFWERVTPGASWEPPLRAPSPEPPESPVGSPLQAPWPPPAAP